MQSVQSTFNVGQMLSLQGIALINGTQMITALTVEGKLLAEVFSRFNDAVSCQRAEKKIVICNFRVNIWLCLVI